MCSALMDNKHSQVLQLKSKELRVQISDTVKIKAYVRVCAYTHIHTYIGIYVSVYEYMYFKSLILVTVSRI